METQAAGHTSPVDDASDIWPMASLPVASVLSPMAQAEAAFWDGGRLTSPIALATMRTIPLPIPGTFLFIRVKGIGHWIASERVDFEPGGVL
jgi:hypothetical protein